MSSQGVSVGKSSFKFRTPSTGRGRAISGNRREILETLYNYPASSISKISREVRLTPNTVKWHLAALKRNEYVNEERIDNRSIFYPLNFVDSVEIHMLAVLNDETCGAIFARVHSTPGRTQKELKEELGLTQNTAGYFLRKLTHIGALEEQQNGKFKYYFPSKLMARKLEDRRGRSMEYTGYLFSKLRSDGMEARDVEVEGSVVSFKIRYRKMEETMTFALNPFLCLLGDRPVRGRPR